LSTISEHANIETTADTTELQTTYRSLSFSSCMGSLFSYNCEAPNLEIQFTKNELLTMYKEMQPMRRMEMAADALYIIRGFCHLSMGQVRRLGSMYNM